MASGSAAEQASGPVPRVSRGPWPGADPWLLFAGFAVFYLVAVVVGRMSRLPGTSLALVWPAAAVAFVWLLWASHRGRAFTIANGVALAVIAGSMNWVTGAKPQVAIALGLANVLQAGVECVIVAKVRPDAWRLRRSSDLAILVVACLAGGVSGAGVGPPLLAAAGGDLWGIAGAWTLRNASNTFVFGAVLLRIAGSGVRSLLPPRQRAAELVLAVAVLGTVYGLIFGLAYGLPLAYLVLPLSIWIALRFPTTTAAAHVLLSAVLVVTLTMAGRGPFAVTAPEIRVLLAQAFVAVTGLVTLVLALHRDERAELIAELREERTRADAQADELRRASELKSQFLTTMSHEIRTPLNGVLGFTTLFAESPGDPRAGEWARAADSAGRALLGIVNNGLDLAKIEAGGVELEDIEFDLADVVREALLPSRVAARGRGVELKLLVGDGLHRRRTGDPVRLRQVLTNLVANAVKFTDEGSVTVAIDGAEDRVRFAVTDTGIGMTDEQRTRLFVPFAQAGSDINRRYGGTGLGLSIAHGLVTVMGGTIEVESQIAHGTTFTVEVPLPRARGARRETELVDAAVPVGPAPPIDAAGEAAGPVEGLKVLVAEDNPVNQMLARATFQARGMAVDVVADGDEAVAAVLNGSYDAVFMDCQMPRMDGLEATRRIRAAETGHVPVIAMTASAFQEDRQAAMAAGMDDFLPKPWSPDELEQVLVRLARQVAAAAPR